jgi:hypothetical protein
MTLKFLAVQGAPCIYDSSRIWVNILIEFCISMKLVRLMKLCLTEKHGRRVGKNLSDMFPIRNSLKQGDALSPLLLNFALEYAIRRVQVNQDVLKFNPLPSLFKSLLPGQEDCVFFSGHLNLHAKPETGIPYRENN